MSLELSSIFAGMRGKKDADFDQISADVHATVERLLGGKEIIKVAHRYPHLENVGSGQFVNLKFKKVLKDPQNKDVELPGWLLKVYENLQEDQSKMHGSWLIQHLGDEFSPGQGEDNLQNTNENSDVDYLFKKFTLAEQLKNYLHLKKLESDLKILRPLQVRNLQEKLDETLIKLKLLLTDKPYGWNEIYTTNVLTIKTIIKKLEQFLKVLEGESDLTKEPSCDNTKAIKVFVSEGKEKLEICKQTLTKIMSEIESNYEKNDDIILVEQVPRESSLSVHSEGKDDL